MLFISKFANLRLILEPKRWKEIDGSKFLTDGLTVEFQNGQFSTKDEELIKKLKNTKVFGRDYWTGEKGKDELTPEAVKEINETKEYIGKLESKCPECGKEFGSEASLRGHMLSHRK